MAPTTPGIDAVAGMAAVLMAVGVAMAGPGIAVATGDPGPRHSHSREEQRDRDGRGPRPADRDRPGGGGPRGDAPAPAPNSHPELLLPEPSVQAPVARPTALAPAAVAAPPAEPSAIASAPIATTSSGGGGGGGGAAAATTATPLVSPRVVVGNGRTPGARPARIRAAAPPPPPVVVLPAPPVVAPTALAVPVTPLTATTTGPADRPAARPGAAGLLVAPAGSGGGIGPLWGLAGLVLAPLLGVYLGHRQARASDAAAQLTSSLAVH